MARGIPPKSTVGSSPFNPQSNAANQPSPNQRARPGCRMLPLRQGAAPLSFIGDYTSTVHKSSCMYSGHEKAAVMSTEHSTRCLCHCMNPFVIDKQFALEIQSRDLTIDAAAIVVTMMYTHGVRKVVADDDLFDILARYDFVSHLYNQIRTTIRESSPPTLPPLHVPPPLCPGLLAPPPAAPPSSPKKGLRKRLSKPTMEQPVPVSFSAEQLDMDFRDAMRGRGRLNYFDEFEPGEWQQMVDEPNVCRVLMKAHPTDRSKASFRIDGYLDTTFSGMLSLVNEVEMSNQWVPYFKFPLRVGLKSASCLERFGRMDKASVYNIDLPWPMRNRDACVHGFLIDDLERNGRIAVCMRSLDSDFPVNPLLLPCGIPDLPKNTLRVGLEGGCIISIVSENRILIENLWNVDLKENIPTTLINFVGGTFIKAAFHSFAKTCLKVSGAEDWKTARAANPWLYAFMSNRVAELTLFGISLPALSKPLRASPRFMGQSEDTLLFLKHMGARRGLPRQQLQNDLVSNRSSSQELSRNNKSRQLRPTDSASRRHRLLSRNSHRSRELSGC